MPVSMAKEQLVRQAWLLFYNKALLDRGIITREQYEAMKRKITSTAG